MILAPLRISRVQFRQDYVSPDRNSGRTIEVSRGPQGDWAYESKSKDAIRERVVSGDLE